MWRVLAALLLCSCIGCTIVRTTTPLYDRQRDTVFDPRLVGTWECHDDHGQPQRLQFARGPERSYVLTTPSAADKEKGASPTMTLDLVPIGRSRYLFFVDPEQSQQTILSFAYRVRLSDDELRLDVLNPEKLREILEERPQELRHRIDDQHAIVRKPMPNADRPATNSSTSGGAIGGTIEITDQPDRVRAFIVRHEDDPDFLVAAPTLRRVRRS